VNKYLFLTSSLPPTKSANGICVQKIIESFAEKDNVFSISFFDAHNLGIPGRYFIPPRRWDKWLALTNNVRNTFVKLFLRMLLLSKRFLMLPVWPVFSFTTVFQFFCKGCDIVKKNDVSHVIAVSYPGETLLALLCLKLRFGKRIKAIAYPLDVTLVGKYDGIKVEQRLSKFFSKFFYRFIFSFIDKVIVLENAADLYDELFHKKIKLKFDVCGIPLVCTMPKFDQLSEDTDRKKHLVYAGNVIKSIRNPTSIFQYLNDLSRGDVIIDIYGSVEAGLLTEWNSRFRNLDIVAHGWINEESLNAKLFSSDALISVGNSVSHLIPSKIFKYMSMNKPIIHQFFDIHDPCIPYLKKYGCCFFFDAEKGCENNFFEWLNRQKNIDVDCSLLFPQCTPAFTARKIELV